MNKDVIYIDVEDDITAIIGKIKASAEKVVALVPPKNAGVLQSAVNLRLLDRMAKGENKNLVIVTNNQALIALTAAARIPVAKNLQSKPELAEVPALIVDDGDDIINGEELPVGEHAASVSPIAAPIRSTTPGGGGLLKKPTRTDSLRDLALDGAPLATTAAVGSVPVRSVAKTAKKKNNASIPNFDTFRKRLLLGLAALVLIVGVLVWAFVFAPAATIVITANTTPQPISATVKLGGSQATDYKNGIVSSEQQQLQKNATVQFTPTGTSQVGNKASGTVQFRNCENNAPETIPSGTVLTTNGMNYTTQADATVPAAQGFATCSRPGVSGDVPVTASNVGASYNVPQGTTFTVSGHSSPNSLFYFSAVATNDFSGGSSQQVTVVSNDDVQRALGTLAGQSDNSVQSQLTSQFKNGEVVITGSYSATQGSPSSSPAVGQQLPSGTSQATLTVPMTYTEYAFPKEALNTYLNDSLNSQLNGSNNQRIYDNGLSKIGFSNFKTDSSGNSSVTLTTTGQVGPKIDEAAVKNMAKGQVAGTVENSLQNINGVQNVQVKYSYFWVSKVPNNTNKITIEFKLKNG